MTEDYTQRFGGIGRLYGRNGMERLASAHVAIIGVETGSWTVEALVRSGIGRVTLVDMDDVCITNVNRQLPALDGAIGLPKVEVLASRLRLIHPGCEIQAVAEFLTAQNAARLLAGPFDCVIDAVDRTSIKSLIIATCVRAGIPVITAGGAGGRRDATAVRCGDLGSTGGDELLRQVRRDLRRNHGFPAGEAPFGVRAIYSAEPQVFPWADGTCRADAEPGGALKMDCASGFGAVTHLTGTFGFAAAGEALRLITTGPATGA